MRRALFKVTTCTAVVGQKELRTSMEKERKMEALDRLFSTVPDLSRQLSNLPLHHKKGLDPSGWQEAKMLSIGLH